MLSFKNYLTEKKIPKPTGGLKDACWSGYTAVGMKMKNGRKVPNCVPEEVQQEAKDEQEYGYEGDMALNPLATLTRCAEMIKELLKPNTDMPEWVQSKITLATDYIQTAADYMYSEMKESMHFFIYEWDKSQKKRRTIFEGYQRELILVNFAKNVNVSHNVRQSIFKEYLLTEEELNANS